MATTALDGTPAHTVRELPGVGSSAPAYTLAGPDLGDVTLTDAAGSRLMLCVSMDLPFALPGFRAAEASTVCRSPRPSRRLRETYGVRLVDSAFAGLLARAGLVLDEHGTVVHRSRCPTSPQEPDYEAVLASLQ